MTEKVQFRIGGMMCSFCSETIRKALSRVRGVKEVGVSMAHEEALIKYEPELVTPGELKEVLLRLGFTVSDPSRLKSYEEEEQALRLEKRRTLTAGVLSLASLTLMLLMWTGVKSPYFKVVMLGLALSALFVGRHILTMAFAAVRKGILNQHVLLTQGALGALSGGMMGFYIQGFPIADFLAVTVFLTAYHLLSGYVSALVRTRSSQAVRRLLEMQPLTARVVREGVEEEVPIEDVRAGDLVIARPGERIPVDGLVAEGRSSVDQALVTGEPLPIDVSEGDEVIGGSINSTGSIKVRATRVGEDSFLLQVARHVEEAKALKPGIIQLVDRILKVYVPGVIAISLGAFLFWLSAGLVLEGETAYIRAAYAALSVLVMGYPCALGMATPLALARGGGMAAERGILMRSGEAFQAFKDVTVVVLDKTGTITKGEPRVVEVAPLHGFGDDEVIRLAGSAEVRSEHSIAKAVVAHAKKAGVALQEPWDFQALPGLGVKARVADKPVVVGTRELLKQEGVELAEALRALEKVEKKGMTSVLVAVGARIAGVIGVSDVIQEDAEKAVAELKALGLKPVMITGDNRRMAEFIASQVGIDEAYSRVLPDKKAEKIRELQKRGYRVAMMGDGINDAPALMQADVGIAIGAGTDIAIESADIVVIGERLCSVPEAYLISRNSYRKTKQNLALAFSFNGIGIPIAATGLLHPSWAMVAMIVSVSTVLLNSFAGRLIKKAEKEGKGLRRLTLKVPTMHCEKCLAAIKGSLMQRRGVRRVEGDTASKLVVVTYDRRANEAGIREAILEAGYRAEGG